ncbi:hypothetical protein CHUAL_001463 [Chamberlinius hualienensis]
MSSRRRSSKTAVVPQKQKALVSKVKISATTKLKIIQKQLFDGFIVLDLSGSPEQLVEEFDAIGSINIDDPSTYNDDLKRLMIQERLLLVIHAYECLTLGNFCTWSLCLTSKGILIHLATCHEGLSCLYPCCYSTRRVISHWENCPLPLCRICLPVKQSVIFPLSIFDYLIQL